MQSANQGLKTPNEKTKLSPVKSAKHQKQTYSLITKQVDNQQAVDKLSAADNSQSKHSGSCPQNQLRR